MEDKVFIETPEGVKEVKMNKEETNQPIISGTFATTKLLVPPVIKAIDAVLVDDKFVQSIKDQDISENEDEYRVRVYEDEVTYQDLVIKREEEKIFIVSNTKDVREDEGYEYHVDMLLELKKGDRISRYGGIFNKVTDGKIITNKIEAAIEILMEK